MSYAELQVTTHFSFLRGASSAQELFETAKALDIEALGIVDRNSLAGIVRALEASRATGLRLVVGCRLDLNRWHGRAGLPDGSPCLLQAHSVDYARQVARRQKQLHPALGRRHRIFRRHDRHPGAGSAG